MNHGIKKSSTKLGDGLQIITDYLQLSRFVHNGGLHFFLLPPNSRPNKPPLPEPDFLLLPLTLEVVAVF
jgi:hypothetical protein